VSRSHEVPPADFETLAGALGDTPETVIEVDRLRRGLCKAWAEGDVPRPDGVIVQSADHPTELRGFGPSPSVLWSLLQEVKGWGCVEVNPGCARGIAAIIGRETGAEVRYYEDIHFCASEPVSGFPDAEVRQLSVKDFGLLAPEVRDWLGIVCDWLPNETVAGAVKAGRVVAVALTGALSERYADVGVFTVPAFRRQGFATAAASIVARRVQDAGRIPVWSTGEDNIASIRVAQKLGFVETSRLVYVIPARILLNSARPFDPSASLTSSSASPRIRHERAAATFPSEECARPPGGQTGTLSLSQN